VHQTRGADGGPANHDGDRMTTHTRIPFRIEAQPDPTSCGPTCLHGVYRHFDDEVPLKALIDDVFQWEQGGGTLAVFLGCHALRRGYRARIYTFNLEVFDPTWFQDRDVDIREKLKLQAALKRKKRLRRASEGYREFLKLGGELRFKDMEPGLIRKYLKRGVPILTGLSATYLYGSPRELPTTEYDDLRGTPAGHFVVLHGYNQEEREVEIADPFIPNPFAEGHYYSVRIERVISAILLGLITYDANLLILEPQGRKSQQGNVKA